MHINFQCGCPKIRFRLVFARITNLGYTRALLTPFGKLQIINP